MRTMLFRVALILFVLSALIGGGTASAANDTVWVDDDGTADPAPGGSCGNPDFNRIQDGVNAAPVGGTVRVCQGTYAEEVEITRTLDLIGVGKPEITPPPFTDPADGERDLVEISGAGVVVEVQGFIIGGEFIAAPDCNASYTGVFIHSDATGIIEHNEISGIVLPVNMQGCQTGNAVQVGSFDGQESFPGTGFIRFNKIFEYQKNGVTVNEPGSYGLVEHNAVDGGGENATIARNGVQIGFDAKGLVQFNRIEGNDYLADDMFTSTGVLVYDSSEASLVQVDNNVLHGNDVGALFESSEDDLADHNVIRDSDVNGLELGTADQNAVFFSSGPTTGATITRNNVRHSGDDGIYVEDASVGNLLQRNNSFENVEHDCHDENGDGPNAWVNNQGQTAQPPTICTTGDGDDAASTSASLNTISATLSLGSAQPMR